MFTPTPTELHSYIGHFDILIGVETMRSFRVAPRIRQLVRLKFIFGNIKKYPEGDIRFRTGVPDHESYTTSIKNIWAQDQYGKGKEEFPKDMPAASAKR